MPGLFLKSQWNGVDETFIKSLKSVTSVIIALFFFLILLLYKKSHKMSVVDSNSLF